MLERLAGFRGELCVQMNHSGTVATVRPAIMISHLYMKLTDLHHQHCQNDSNLQPRLVKEDYMIATFFDMDDGDYVWHLSHKELNQQMHALNGNSTMLPTNPQLNQISPAQDPATQHDLSNTNYASRLYLATLYSFGPDRFRQALKAQMEVTAIVAAFTVTFLDTTLPDSVKTGSNLARAYVILSGLAQIFALSTVIVAVLCYVQVSFYSDTISELSTFVRAFTFFLVFPIVTLITSLALSTCAINVRFVLLYDSAVWMTLLIGTIIIGIPTILAYPLMDPVLRRTRFETLKKTPTRTIDNPTFGFNGEL
eukprot:m.268741 g.268741  ORF g.268741 m.268741 type:complete len:310 (-) comp38530_c0_seq1:83-1012(-)